VSPAVVSGCVAAVCFLLGRWGLRNTADLLAAGASPERRAREERNIRRGARSCYLLAGLFGLLAALLALEVVANGTTL